MYYSYICYSVAIHEKYRNNGGLFIHLKLSSYHVKLSCSTSQNMSNLDLNLITEGLSIRKEVLVIYNYSLSAEELEPRRMSNHGSFLISHLLVVSSTG